MATHIWGNGMEFENPLVVTLDNKLVYETVIGGEEDMKALRSGAERRTRSRQRPPEEDPVLRDRGATQDWRRRSSAGRSPSPTTSCRCSRRVAVRIVSIACNSFQLQGPFDAKGIGATPSRERIFTCHPEGQREAQACVRRSRSSRRSPGAHTGGRCLPKTSTS